MKENGNERVLAYKTALKLTNDDLMKISGGSSKLTVNGTQKITGAYPGVTDVDLDQIWD